jgi:phage terminase small subunit
MKKMQITVLEEYCGEYSVITGAYSKDLLLDVID